MANTPMTPYQRGRKAALARKPYNPAEHRDWCKGWDHAMNGITTDADLAAITMKQLALLSPQAAEEITGAEEIAQLKLKASRLEDPLQAAVNDLIAEGNEGPWLLSELRLAIATFENNGIDIDPSNFRCRAMVWVRAGRLVADGMKATSTRPGRTYRLA